MKGWAGTARSTGSRWSGWCERSWSAGSRMTRPPKWAIGWEHRWGLAPGAPGRPPPSQMVSMQEQETGGTTSMCSLSCVGDPECFRSVFSQQIQISQHRSPARGDCSDHSDLADVSSSDHWGHLSLGEKSKYLVHKSFSGLCKPLAMPAVTLGIKNAGSWMDIRWDKNLSGQKSDSIKILLGALAWGQQASDKIMWGGWYTKMLLILFFLLESTILKTSFKIIWHQFVYYNSWQIKQHFF